MSAFAIVALIIGGIKRDDVRGIWLDSRYEYMHDRAADSAGGRAGLEFVSGD